MPRSARQTPYVRFASASLLAVVLVGTAFCMLGLNMVTGRERDAAHRSAAALAAEPLLALFEGGDPAAPLPADVRTRADVLVLTLGSGGLRGARVTAEETVLYEAGTLPADDGAAGGSSADGLFTTAITEGALTVLVAEEPSGVDGAIRSARWQLIAMVIAFGWGAWLLLQGAFWWGINAFAREHVRLAYLYDTGQQMRSSLDLHDVLSRLVRDGTAMAGGSHGLVALFDDETSEVMLRATFDRAADSLALHQRPIDEWFIRRAIATATTTVNPQAGTAVRALFGEASAMGEGTLLCAPMAIRDRVVGAIAIVRSEEGRPGFAPAEVRLVEQLGMQAAAAIEQALLFSRVRANAREIENSYDSTLKALMAALDSKDDASEGHCERVARMTILLARQMEMPEDMMVHIERGALLHDLGKIGVPDSILNKPRALTDSEWEAMRKHPLLAGLMVSKIGFLEPALPILLYHHERFDGSGYPFGLAGGNIPLEARIFAIIDAYDAMTSDRPYRPAMRHAEAMTEVRRHSGTQFDPDAVDSFNVLMAAHPELRDEGGRRVLGMHDIEHLDSTDEHVA